MAPLLERSGRSGGLRGVERAPYGEASSTLIQDVRVDHRGADVAVAEELLNRSDIDAVLQQMGSETVA
jgi:hypothetical protein